MKKGLMRSVFFACDLSSASRCLSVSISYHFGQTAAPDIFFLLRIYRMRWSGHVCM